MNEVLKNEELIEKMILEALANILLDEDVELDLEEVKKKIKQKILIKK